jgi:hypothetical protein
VIRRIVQIPLGRLQVRVPKHILYLAEEDPVFLKCGSQGMAAAVRDDPPPSQVDSSGL